MPTPAASGRLCRRVHPRSSRGRMHGWRSGRGAGPRFADPARGPLACRRRRGSLSLSGDDPRVCARAVDRHRRSGGVARRHAAYFADYLGEQYDVILSGEQHQAIVEIAGEIGNVRAAWAWAVTARRYDLLSRSANGLTWYFELHSNSMKAKSRTAGRWRPCRATRTQTETYWQGFTPIMDNSNGWAGWMKHSRNWSGVAQGSARRICRMNWQSH